VNLFDENAIRSEEPAAFFTCRDLIAACTAAIELLEVTTAEEAAAKITVGPMKPPADNQAFSKSELKNRHVWGQIMPNPEQDSLVVTRSRAVGCVSEKAGSFRLNWRRQVRDAEYNNEGGRRDAYLFFDDCTAAIAEQLVEAADLNLAVHTVRRLAGPDFNASSDWPTQGRFIMADFLIEWGGSERAE
jgi:hypothetical protein